MKFHFGRKKPQYYKGLLIKADLGLHDQIAEKIQNEVKQGGAILDLGAGEGALSQRLSDMGYLVTAVDMDSDNFKCADVKFTKVNFDSTDEVSHFVSQHEGEFDAVMGIEVIEHVEDQWQYVRQLLRMAKKGGLVIITTPNTTSWISRLVFFFTGRFHQFLDDDLSYGHISPISPWELELILKKSGADQVKILPAGTLPPIYITGFNKLTILGLLILPVRLVMRGILDGWCVMASARRK